MATKKKTNTAKDMAAPVEKSPETAFQAEMTDAEYQDFPKAVQESVMRPSSPVDMANEEINTNYPWSVPSMTGPQRALLCELIRIRKLLEAQNGRGDS